MTTRWRAALVGVVLLFACGGPRSDAPASSSSDGPAAHCKTACDCPTPGHTCHEGQCKSGTIALFCCEKCPQEAPPAQACQKRDGSFGTCGAARP